MAVEEAAHLAVWAFAAGARPAGSEGLAVVYTRQRIGARAWLVCPGCGRRAACLYRPGPDRTWECRTCHGLTYLSRRHAHREGVVRRAACEAAEILSRTGGDWDAVLRAWEGASPAEWIALGNYIVMLGNDLIRRARGPLAVESRRRRS